MLGSIFYTFKWTKSSGIYLMTLLPGLVQVNNDRVYIGAVDGTVMEVVTMNHELNIGSISGKTMDQHIDYLVDKLVQYNIGGGEKYDGLISGNIELGNYVDMGGHTWLVCHIDENDFYLILNTVTDQDKFGASDYSGSNMATKCATFLSTLSGPVQTLLQMTEVEGVTAKIFVPTVTQIFHSFLWFSSADNRIARDNSGVAQRWWTSTTYGTGGVYRVGQDGNQLGGTNSDNGYFRPACRIKLE